LLPGQGAFVDLPQASELTFVGEVPQGNLANPVPAQLSIRSSMVPQAGGLSSDLGFVAQDGDEVSCYNPVSSSYEVYSFVAGVGWVPSEPALEVGTSFWFDKPAPSTWERTFSVWEP